MGCKGSTLTGQKVPVFRDVYEVRDKLGEGAFGVVHEVVRRETGESFAVKMIDRAFADANEMERETAMLRSLEHPNVVRCVDVYMDQCFCYIVMCKYSGGDMVDGLQGHLKSKGKIPDVKALSPVKQMLTAIGFIHSKGVIHRDVKGDNFLMSIPDIVDPSCVIALSDFGTAVHLQKGHKLSEHTGTSIFWAPEVINKNYEFLADVWAVGIVMFGLLDGTFPFRDARQILQKPLRHPKASKLALQLLAGLLEKDPSKRMSAEQGLNHPWMKSAGDKSKAADRDKPGAVSSAPKEEEKEAPSKDQGAEMGMKLRVEGVGEAIAQRRQQLMREMEEKHKKEAETPSAAAGGRKSLLDSRVAFEAKDFTISGSRPGEKVHFQWVDIGKAIDRGVMGIGCDQKEQQAAKPLTSGNESEDPEAIRQILDRHGVDTTRFGMDQAKTLGDFVRECLRGEAVLAVDSKRLIRVVDVVIVRLCDVENGKRMLVEKTHELSDGRVRTVNRLPGTKRRPHESTKATAMRVISTMLHLQPSSIAWLGQAEQFEEMEMSVSYPGMETVYRKYVMKACVVATEKDVKAAIGLPKFKDFRTAKGDGREYSTWGWLNDKQCQKLGIKAQGNQETSRFAGLAPVKVNMTTEGVKEMMESHGIDTSLYGEGSAATLDEIATEVQVGECDLMMDNEKGLIRIVNVVLLRLREQNGKVLIESERTSRDGTSKVTNRLPGNKQRPHENAFHTARRILTTTLAMKEDDVTFNVAECQMLEEEKESPSYPGLKTVYRKHVVDASIGRDPDPDDTIKPPPSTTSPKGKSSPKASDGKSPKGGEKPSRVFAEF